MDLLEKVGAFKSRFFASSWAHYDTAHPDKLKLRPTSAREAELRRDYAKMEPMFLAAPAPFQDILKVLDDAQREINTRKPT